MRLALVLVLTASLAPASLPGQTPNVVWLVAEDMSAWLPCYGDATVETPALDRFAAASVRYTHAFATSPVCAPARSSLITGMFATRIGTMHMRTNSPSAEALARDPDAYADIPGYEGLPPPFVRCFPELLRARGYYCTNAAKKDYQFEEPATVWDESSNQAHWRNRAAGQPFFAVFNHGGTHESQTFPATKAKPRVVDRTKVPLPPFYPDTPAVREAVARTYDNIAAMDRWVDARLRELEQDGLLASTIVMFYSDHGVGLPRGKRSCYDTGTRVPLLVRFPDGHGAGTTDDRVVSFVDFGPTVLSLCGLDPDRRLDGVPFLGAHARPGSGLAFAHADRFDAVYDRQRSVRDGRFRYVRNHRTDLPYLIANAYREQIPMTADLYALRDAPLARQEQWQLAARTRPAEEFYDSAADPWEVRNLIDAPEHREHIARLRAALDAWVADTGDLGFVLPETRLVREHIWPPDGVQPTTPAAVLEGEAQADGVRVTLRCEDPGASIGWRTQRQGAWHVYTGPFTVPNGATLNVRTHRIGHRQDTVERAVSDLAAPRRRPPNVLVIVADDLGAMDVGPSNPACAYDTPALDAFARTAVRFTHGYAASPVCSPTRYSLLTGRYPTRVAATEWFSGKRVETFRPAESTDRMPLEEVTVAEVLKAHGYATFFAGKWHLGPTEEFWPEAQGFDVNKGGFARGGPYGPGQYFVPYGNPRLEDGPPGEHLPDRLASETCAFLEQHRDGPFLAWLSFYSVHTPLVGRPDLVAKYEKRMAALRRDGEAEFGPEEQVYRSERQRQTRVLQRHAVYAAMVEAMDQAIGKVLARLDALGLADDTIVVFTSDNGGLSTSEGSPTSNLPFRAGKGWLYEGGLRTPWLVRAPGITAKGATDATPISTIDLLPTVLDLAGLPAVTHAVDGASFAPLLRGSDAAALAARPLFWHYPHYGNQGGFPGGAVRIGMWKLIERFEDGRVHLFDLAHDPGERTDLAAAEPDRVATLRARLREFQRAQDARFLRPRPDGPEPWQPR